MSNVLAIINAVEERLLLIAAAGAVAYHAADPTALNTKWTAAVVAASGIALKLAPAAAGNAPVADAAANDVAALVDQIKAGNQI